MDFNLKFSGAKTKCSTCNYSFIYSTVRDTVVECHYGKDKIMREPVVECSSYEEKNSQSLYEMKEKAWILEVKKGRVIGFVSQEELRKRGGND